MIKVDLPTGQTDGHAGFLSYPTNPGGFLGWLCFHPAHSQTLSGFPGAAYTNNTYLIMFTLLSYRITGAQPLAMKHTHSLVDFKASPVPLAQLFCV